MHPIFGNPAYGQQTDPEPGSVDPPPQLDATDHAILTNHLLGHTPSEIALVLGLTAPDVITRMAAPLYQALKRAVETRTLERVADLQAVEPITRAKAAAPDAMGTIIRLSRNSQDPRVKLKAAEGILRYAGVEPARKVELTAPDRLLELMTPGELLALADRKLWPSRFKDQLRHLLPVPLGPDGPILDVTPEPTPEAAAQDWDAPPPSGDGGISEERLKETTLSLVPKRPGP